MYKLQCDKNLIKVLEKIFLDLNIQAEISLFSDEKADISILRNPEGINTCADFTIINSDDKELINIIKGSKSKIITCGLSTRSTVTFSSISERGCVMCLQRSLNNLKGEKMPPFELPFECCGKLFDDVSILMILTAALLCGAEVSKLNKIYL